MRTITLKHFYFDIDVLSPSFIGIYKQQKNRFLSNLYVVFKCLFDHFLKNSTWNKSYLLIYFFSIK